MDDRIRHGFRTRAGQGRTDVVHRARHPCEQVWRRAWKSMKMCWCRSIARQCTVQDGSAVDEGVLLSVSGSVREPDSTPGADFDYGQYLRRRGINIVLSASRQNVEVLPERRGGLSGLVDGIRRHSRESLGIGGWGDASELLRGMVLGRRRQDLRGGHRRLSRGCRTAPSAGGIRSERRAAGVSS